MLTIGQLAATAGVTVRTVRHYHQVGLLPEPERDASGYRRYSAQAAVDLVRIRTLAEAGVPLARIDALLRAQPTEFAAAITDIDTALQAKIDQLTEHRRRCERPVFVQAAFDAAEEGVVRPRLRRQQIVRFPVERDPEFAALQEQPDRAVEQVGRAFADASGAALRGPLRGCRFACCAAWRRMAQ